VKILAAVPDGRRDYKPDPKSRTAWELAKHLATSDVWFLQSVIDARFAIDPAEAEKMENQFSLRAMGSKVPNMGGGSADEPFGT
jgi:hypothetical protein